MFYISCASRDKYAAIEFRYTRLCSETRLRVSLSHTFFLLVFFVYGIDRFGASAPTADLAEEFGFTPDRLAACVLDHLRSDGSRKA